MLRLLLLCGVAAALTVVADASYYRSSGRSKPGSNGADSCVVPPEYYTLGTYQDDDAFWMGFEQALRDNQCSSVKSDIKNCRRFLSDPRLRWIRSYLRKACKSGDFRPGFLRTPVQQYCQSHSTDENVGSAFECSTGCKLVDNLNQLCQDINNPATTTTEPTTTTTPCVDSGIKVSCGDTITVSEGDFKIPVNTSADFSFPCNGYPRDVNPCIITFEADQFVSPATLNSFGLRITFQSFDVPCTDTVSVFSESMTELVAPSCNDNTTLVNNQISTNTTQLIVQLDLADGMTSGIGFTFDYRIC